MHKRNLEIAEGPHLLSCTLDRSISEAYRYCERLTHLKTILFDRSFLITTFATSAILYLCI